VPIGYRQEAGEEQQLRKDNSMADSQSQSVNAGAVDETSTTVAGRSIMTNTSSSTYTGHGAGADAATRTTKSSRASCRTRHMSRTIGFVVIAMVVSYTMVCQFQQMPHYLQQEQTLQKLLNQDDHDHDLFHDFNGTENNNIARNTKNVTTTLVPVIDYNYTFLKYDDNTKFSVPVWLDEFLQSQPTASHHHTLTSPHNKFLVMTCHKYANHIVEACGGIADRFKLLRYNLWLAHQTGRTLLIKYSKPSPLEDYLVPVPPLLPLNVCILII
jgi:hypothetical protein